MKILVTGNCGFIGQNFVHMYNKKHHIIGMDKLGYASDKKALKLCKTYILDISKIEQQKLNQIFIDEKFDAVINFAAESHVDNSINSPYPFIHGNIMSTFKLLEAARNIKIKRFIQIGTDEVYGDLQLEDPPFSNLNELKPSSPYSSSKASTDLIALSYVRTYNMNISVTRSCNNYGPFQYKEKFIPVIIDKIMHNQQIPIYGTGKNMREWIYVKDNCKAVMKILKHGKSGEIYNIGSGIEIDNIELVKIILKIMKKPEKLIKMVEDRKGHDFRYFMDKIQLKSQFNWEPKISLLKGLKKTINWSIK